MKHESTISLWSQISSQLSGQQQVKAIQNDQRCKHQQARFWPLYFGIDFLEKGRTINSEYYIALLVRLMEEIVKKRPQRKKESALSPRQSTMSQVDQTMAKLHELHFELLPHPLYSPDLALR